MCNMAAYIGTKPAVKELIELLRVQEGLAGGHFTGITTLHEGKLYTEKVCGDLEDLLKKTSVLDLPGTIGIAHSRTPGHPEDTWAQPFTAPFARTVFCANGVGAGKVLPFPEDTFLKAEKLLASTPCKLTTGVEKDLTPYPALSDGKFYHSTEIESALIGEFHLQGADMRQALQKAFTFMPNQIAALAMAEDEPDTITVLRYNQALFFGQKEDGAYTIATSCTAFQDLGYKYFQAVPAGTIGKLTRDGFTLETIESHLDKLVLNPPYGEAARFFDGLLSNGKEWGLLDLFDELVKVPELSPPDRSPQDSYLLYTYLAEKCRKGELVTSYRMVPGSRPGSLRKETTFRKV